MYNSFEKKNSLWFTPVNDLISFAPTEILHENTIRKNVPVFEFNKGRHFHQCKKVITKKEKLGKKTKAQVRKTAN